MKGKFKLNHLIVHLILLVGVIVVVFPFAWMILTSFKTSGEAMKIPPTIFPEKFVTTAYHTIVTSAIPFATVYMNTIITTVVTTLVQIVFCSMAGYAFGRIEFPFKNAIFILVLSVLMVPGQIFLLPQYQIVQKLGLLDTIPALFLPNLFSAFGTFLLLPVLYVSAERTGRSSHRGRMRTFPYLRTDHAAADQTGYRGNVHLYHQVCME